MVRDHDAGIEPGAGIVRQLPGDKDDEHDGRHKTPGRRRRDTVRGDLADLVTAVSEGEMMDAAPNRRSMTIEARGRSP